MNSFLKKECDLEFFHENGYVRKKCKSCGAYYWTLNKDSEFCGDKPCVDFSFIGNPLGKKPLSLSEVRESFLSFFERNNHSRLHYPETGERCPVVARWRSDIYLTIASIADFQPHVTSGVVPPPANPLVISQPCIRLNDLEEIGVSGRHLSMFEMMGHHAFNKNIDEIYWKNETVQFCDEYFTKHIGIPQDSITYKEQLWYGGGNAGPCLEVLAAGLEIATLVFMNMKEDENGDFIIDGEKYSPNPLNIVDTGYGLERIAWITQGTATVYDTVFPEMIEWLGGYTKNIDDISAIYILADHSRCLAFMLGDGIVPSNVKAGYLARLIIRRSLRFIKKLHINLSLRELVDFQLELLEKDFPSLKKQKTQIDEIIDLETEKFFETLSKGEKLVKRLLKEKKGISDQDFIMLYDTHGMPLDVVQKIAENEGEKDIKIPENFDSMLAELHSHEEKEEDEKEIRTNLPSTERLYYKDHYMREFDAKVLWVNVTKNGTEVILDKTCFYPEGGGQPNDIGFLDNGKKLAVTNVYKEGNAIIHLVDGRLKVDEKIHGVINWNHRYILMKHHTGTHLVNGALRKIFGNHIWQAGSQLSINDARFDFSHYKSLSSQDIKKIEKMANQFIRQSIDVHKRVMNRNDAEKTYGFRLYQGGVPPGDEIRVLDIPEVDVEACGGTHLNNTSEVGKIRIVKTERIQDGVNRIVFAAGETADEYYREEQKLYDKIVGVLDDFYLITDNSDISTQIQKASNVFSVPHMQLEKTIIRFLKEASLKKERKKVKNLKEACMHLFDEWKNTQKAKKKISDGEISQIKSQAEIISGTNIKVVVATTTSDSTYVSTAITSENDYIAHIADGTKITSTASSNVDIDLREIAPEIGKILGGSGGGKPKMTQCGGPNKSKIPEALKKAKELTKMKLKK